MGEVNVKVGETHCHFNYSVTFTVSLTTHEDAGVLQQHFQRQSYEYQNLFDQVDVCSAS